MTWRALETYGMWRVCQRLGKIIIFVHTHIAHTTHTRCIALGSLRESSLYVSRSSEYFENIKCPRPDSCAVLRVECCVLMWGMPEVLCAVSLGSLA